MYYERRGSKYIGFTYLGFKSEQLCDTFGFNACGVSFSGEVDRIVLRADKNGIRTTITAYDDGYCTITE